MLSRFPLRNGAPFGLGEGAGQSRRCDEGRASSLEDLLWKRRESLGAPAALPAAEETAA